MSTLEHTQSLSFILIVVIVAMAFVATVLMCGMVHHASSFYKIYKGGDDIFREDFCKAVKDTAQMLPTAPPSELTKSRLVILQKVVADIEANEPSRRRAALSTRSG